MDQHVDDARAVFPGTGGWRKSSYSNPSGNCVAAAGCDTGVAVRDSRFPEGPALAFTRAAWHAFLRGLGEVS